jgi:hypothetical protein
MAGGFVQLYVYDSYDLTAFLTKDGAWQKDDETNGPGYQRAYSYQWTFTSIEGQQVIDPRQDASNQVKYPSAPIDATMLTSCTYHALVAHTATCPVIFTSGTVRPIDVKKFYQYGWDVANHP